MKRMVFCMLMIVNTAVAGTVWAGDEKPEPLRLELELVSGSRIIGVPSIESVSLQTSYAKMDIKLKQILTIKIDDNHETASVDLRNGDKLKGVINLAPIKLETVFGTVKIGIEHISRLRVVSDSGTLPAGEGPIAFGGVNWITLRRDAEVQGDKLVTLPRARPGFNYGHGGNGRGSWLMTNIDSVKWKDYSVEFEFCMPGMEGGAIMFHVVDLKESWNECGWSTYYLAVGADGSWGLSCMYNQYCRVPAGYSDMRADGERSLASGKGVKIDPRNGNRFRIDVSGTRIRAWADGEQILDVQDDKMGDAIGGKTLDHGGVGFSWTHDSTGWIRNFSAKGLAPSSGKDTLAFGGVDWTPWRTLFEVQGDKLVSLPKARPGFNYGHSGNGRGPVLVADVGSKEWKDYVAEFDFCMSGVDASFNPYRLPLTYRNGSIMFHVVDAKESFNERGASCYVINFEESGAWNLRCTYNEYCAVPAGYGNPTSDGGRTLAKGQGLKLDAVAGNKFRIELRGARIQIMVDGEKLVDVTDDKMGEAIGGQTLDYGGMGFVWGMDSMGWIRHFSIRKLK